MNYGDFLSQKRKRVIEHGFDVSDTDINPMLYDWQRVIVRWAVKVGRAAMFEDCGLGKTPQQLEWARLVCEETKGRILILTPLAVAEQTAREAAKFHIDARVVRDRASLGSGINITNYEILEHFQPDDFVGVVLDESSILKNYSGSYRKMLTEFAREMRFRLACTATPAPNDITEIINHSEFLGVMSGKEAIALWFRQDGNTTHAYRLKGHAIRDFYSWMASWARAVRSPADLGFDDGAFKLPPLRYHEHIVDGHLSDGFLFPIEASTLQERGQARKKSINARCGLVAELANATDRPFLVWCGLNAESELCKRMIPDAVEVKGSDSNAHKIDAMLGFADGKYRAMITKPSIAGFGMNWQHCSKEAFVGLSDSWEQYYQAMRRCWRFGQQNPVDIHVVVAETEGAVLANIQRKERDAARMMSELVGHMGIHYKHSKDDSRYDGNQAVKLPTWMRVKS